MLKKFLKNKSNQKFISKTILGLERETIRVGNEGKISLTPHPEKLGAAYTHPLIKTDFSESQVEYATKPSIQTKIVLKNLADLHSFTYKAIDKENLWPFSMPPQLPDLEDEIPLAVYGNTPDAEKKTIYRRGLGHRYGRKMQTISGVHVNISFSKPLMEWVSKNRYGVKLTRDIQSEIYLDTIRNFNRYSFLILYFFGASPAMHKSFTKKNPLLQEYNNDTYFGQYATTLRLSELGYTSQVQKNIFISTNSIQEYIESLCYAINTQYTPYTKFNDISKKEKHQLNDHYLQLENEYYALIRPKQIPKNDERPIDSLNKRGIRYLEVRCIDVDPFSPIGVSEEAILFTQIYLMYCLLEDSPKTSQEEKINWDRNQFDVCWNGRNLKTEYTVFDQQKTIIDFGNSILDKLQGIAEFWDRNSKSVKYTEVIKNQRFKLEHPEVTPSGSILKIFERDKVGFLELGNSIAKKYKAYFLQRGMEEKVETILNEMRDQSLNDLIQIEKNTLAQKFEKLEKAEICIGKNK
jgi:glutamate--cysteine ligase